MKLSGNSTDIRFGFFLILLTVVLSGVSCSSSKPYTLRPIKTFDPDTADIPKPKPNPSYQYWDRIDNTIFHQLEKPLNLNKTFRAVGRLIGIAQPPPADNVNHLGEVPESSWYNHRHYYDTLSTRQLARGPNTVPPDTSGPWTIISAKLEGANPGFFIRDARGNRYLIKFDGDRYPELLTAASVISTKLFYAAGYNVPEATITYFDPDQVHIGKGVTVMENGKKRPMTREDYHSIIKNKTRDKHGKVRAVASKFVEGTPVGPWGFEGTRNDDPNDRVAHQHRREIRAMRIFSSWVNDTDRREANTMAVYTNDNYIKHYVQDFGNTLGANGVKIHTAIYGQAYLIDPRYMFLQTVSLGTYVTPWDTINAKTRVPYPSVGYFRADVFKPGQWVSAHPLPAYENMTLRDAFWGAKQVMSFSNEDIRAIVQSGQITNPRAEQYLVRVLAKRRDKIGRYWFNRINPIDKFLVEQTDRNMILSFHDLGIEGNLYEPKHTHYAYSIRVVNGPTLQPLTRSQHPHIRLSNKEIPTRDGEQPVILKYNIITRRTSDVAEKSVFVYIAMENDGPRIVGIHREI